MRPTSFLPALALSALLTSGCMLSQPGVRSMNQPAPGWSGPAGVSTSVAGTTGETSAGSVETANPSAPNAVCFVEAPRLPDATATRRVLKRPARTTSANGAWSNTRMDAAAQRRKVEGTTGDAQTASVPVPNSTKVGDVTIPAEWVDVPAESEPGLAWIPSVCDASIDRALTLSLQRSLRRLGYYVGAEDGLFGPQTHAAVEMFKRDRLLYGDGITFETLDALAIPRPEPPAVSGH